MDRQLPERRDQHPTYVKEQRRVASMMIALLVRRGIPADEAQRKAIEMITRTPERETEDAA
jgi:hypothetical protein